MSRINTYNLKQIQSKVIQSKARKENKTQSELTGFMLSATSRHPIKLKGKTNTVFVKTVGKTFATPAPFFFNVWEPTRWLLTGLFSCACRVFGFSPIIQNNCSHTWKLIVHPERKWYHFVNPIMLLILYYTLATLIRLWLQEPIDQMTVSTRVSDDGRRFPFRGAVMFAAKSISGSAIDTRWQEVNWTER